MHMTAFSFTQGGDSMYQYLVESQRTYITKLLNSCKNIISDNAVLNLKVTDTSLKATLCLFTINLMF